MPNLALQTKLSFVFAHVERGVRPVPPPNGDINVATRLNNHLGFKSTKNELITNSL
jgi:hypothetical protein